MRSLCFLSTLGIALRLGSADELGNLTDTPSAVPVASKKDSEPSIRDLLVDDRQFSMFVMALEETDLLDALDSRGPFTVFAPTNRAFSQLPNYVFKTLLSDTRRLRKIVLNHALGGEMYTDEMQDGDELETLHDLYLEVDDLGYAIAVDGAQIVEADLEARNGVLDAIDGVLLPCWDSKTWRKKFTGENCAWVAKHRPRCDTKGEDNVRAWYACPYACDSGCFDSPDWHKEDTPWKDCEWVSIKPETRCGVEGEDGSLARQECPTACSDPGPFKDRGKDD